VLRFGYDVLRTEPDQSMPRNMLLDRLWPHSEPSLAGQSLNTLVYNLHRLLEDSIGGVAPVLHHGGGYRLNIEAGVGVDMRACPARTGARPESETKAL
jgi:DNA-binding SARP family transcriptional activator